PAMAIELRGGHHLQYLGPVAVDLDGPHTRHGEELLPGTRLRLGDSGEDTIREDVECGDALVRGATAPPGRECVVDGGIGGLRWSGGRGNGRVGWRRRRAHAPSGSVEDERARQDIEQLDAEASEPRRPEPVNRGELGSATRSTAEELVDRTVREDDIRRDTIR